MRYNSTQHSALSTQHSALSTQHSALSTQHSASSLDHDSTYIEYPLRTLVTQIEPRLDIFWQTQLLRIFENISPQARKNVAEQLLKPKNIFWNPQKKTFEYKGEHWSFHEWVRNAIPSGMSYMKRLGLQLSESLQTLASFQELNQTGDYLDSLFEQIDKVDIKHNLQHQIFKQKLRNEFIYAVAEVIQKG